MDPAGLVSDGTGGTCSGSRGSRSGSEIPFPLMPLFGCGHGFWICLLLIFLAYIPGIMYDVYAISN